MAKVTGKLTDFGLDAMLGKDPQLVFQFVSAAGDTSAIAGVSVLANRPVVVAPQYNGFFEADLTPTDKISPAGHYRISVRWRDETRRWQANVLPWQLLVPAAGGVLADLLRVPSNPALVFTGPTPPPNPAPGSWWLDPASADLSEHNGAGWTYKANLRGIPGYNATDAAGDDAAIARFISEAAGTTKAAAAVRGVARQELQPLSREITRSTITRRPRKPLLEWAEHAGEIRQPMSIGSDGYIYGGRLDGSNMPIRSNDGFLTVDGTARSFSSQGDSKVLRTVYKVAEGWVAVTSANASDDTSTVWFTKKWADTPWTRVLDIGHTLPISIGRPTPKADGSGTVWLIGEYGNRDSRKLWLSEDGGQTWRSIYTHTRRPNGAGNNTHIHHASYDPYTGRIWLSCGDGVNNWFGYSDNLGGSWTDVPAAGAGPEDAGTIYNHPTVLTPTSSRMVSTPDGSYGGNGVWTIDKETGRVTIAHEVAKTEPYRAWSRAPWAQRGDEIYIMFPPDEAAGEVEEIIVAGTGDGGRSWHTLTRMPINKSVDQFFTGMVGPDDQGRLWMLAKRSGVQKLYVAQTSVWEDVAVDAQLQTNKGAVVLSHAAPPAEVSSSSAETVLAQLTLPAKLARDGDLLRLKASGTYANTGTAAADVIFKVRARNITPISTGAVTLQPAANERKWSLEVDLPVTGVFIDSAAARFLISKASGASLPVGGDAQAGAGSVTMHETTVTPLPLQIRASSSRADALIRIALQSATLEIISL